MREQYFFGMLTGFVVATVLRFLAMGLTEAIVKPIAVAFARNAADKFLFPAFEVMDELLVLPDQWEQFVDEKTAWVKKAVLPEIDTFPLTEKQIDDLADLLVQNFSLQTFLEKAHGQK